MSKEVAAAILTRIYFDKVPGAGGTHLHSHSGIVSPEAAEQIGQVYVHYLSKLDLFGTWAQKKR